MKRNLNWSVVAVIVLPGVSGDRRVRSGPLPIQDHFRRFAPLADLIALHDALTKTLSEGVVDEAAFTERKEQIPKTRTRSRHWSWCSPTMTRPTKS